MCRPDQSARTAQADLVDTLRRCLLPQRPGLADSAGWSGSIHCEDTIMLVFSWNGSNSNFQHYSELAKTRKLENSNRSFYSNHILLQTYLLKTAEQRRVAERSVTLSRPAFENATFGRNQAAHRLRLYEYCIWLVIIHIALFSMRIITEVHTKTFAVSVISKSNFIVD